jgi:hypothetical protein
MNRLLGEFSAIGHLLTLVSFSKKLPKEVAAIFRYFFLRKRCALNLKPMGWATFWEIFPQTHLVTLAETILLYRLNNFPGKWRHLAMLMCSSAVL